MRRTTIILVLVLLLSPGGLAGAEGRVETVVRFAAAHGQFPEGIAVDARSNTYVSLAPLGQIWRIAPDRHVSLFASLVDPASLPLPLGALGLALDPSGQLYAALASSDPRTHGVWRLSHDGAHKERLAGSEAIVLPNALAFDEHRTLYVTDSLRGAIWRIPPGGPAHVLLQHGLLAGMPVAATGGLPVGANGIAYWDKTLFVANTTTKQVLRVPLGRDGHAGEPDIMHSFTEPDAYLDGLAVDVRGNLYPLVTGRSTLVQLTQAGHVTTLATAEDGLDYPASAAFGTGHGNRGRLFVTNFAVFPSPAAERPGPGVVRVEVGVP